jgi:MtfA peptidase
MFGRFRNRRRERLRSQPFPPAWLTIIERNVSIYDRLPQADQRELHGHIQVFLAEKHFEGCGGLELTDEIKVTIAAQACLLLLHRETSYYPRLITILVYPHAYVAKSVESIGGGIVLEGETARLGEAWKEGVVVLSWDDVRRGASDLHDGHNVVLHEFAHQLDQQDGTADGAPILEHRSQYVTWARVLSDEYDQLRRDTEQGRRDVLDEYGATNPAEFFAVATECFFEKPSQLRRKHPQLYEELKAYYRQDPAELVPGERS